MKTLTDWIHFISDYHEIEMHGGNRIILAIKNEDNEEDETE